MSWNIKIWSCKISFRCRLTWQAALKKSRDKLDFLTDIDILLTVERGIRGWIFHSIYRYAKANSKYMKNCNKNWDVNDLYGWTMSQKLLVNNFEWIKDDSQFNEDFIKD